MTIEVIDVPIKALAPLDVTFSGMVKAVSPVHPAKADAPIDVASDGIVILVSILQFFNTALQGDVSRLTSLSEYGTAP